MNIPIQNSLPMRLDPTLGYPLVFPSYHLPYWNGGVPVSSSYSVPVPLSTPSYRPPFIQPLPPQSMLPHASNYLLPVENNPVSHVEFSAHQPTDALDLRAVPWRYLGYANELGAALKEVIPAPLVRLSDWIALGYAAADALTRGKVKYNEAEGQPHKQRILKAAGEVIESGVFQLGATVYIPVRVIHLAQKGITKFASRWIQNAKHLRILKTGVSIGIIPFIIKPIDTTVEEGIHLFKQGAKRIGSKLIPETKAAETTS